MRITKSQSRFLAVGILVVFFIVVVTLVKSNTSSHTRTVSLTTTTVRQTTTVPPQEAQPAVQPSGSNNSVAPQFSLKSFHRSEIKDGRKVWEIKADSGELVQGTNVVKLINSDLWLYRKSGEVVTLKSDQAFITLVGASLDHAQAIGAVKINYNQQATLETEKANYDQKTNMVDVPGPVHIFGDQFDLTGDKMTMNVETKEVFISPNVKTLLKPKKSAGHAIS